MNKFYAVLSIAASVAVAAPVFAQKSSHQQLTIQSPANGATVGSPVTVAFGYQGEGAPSAKQAYLFVDQALPEEGTAVNADQSHIFAVPKAVKTGHSELSLTLTPGKHTLALITLSKGKAGRTPKNFAPVTITVQ